MLPPCCWQDVALKTQPPNVPCRMPPSPSLLATSCLLCKHLSATQPPLSGSSVLALQAGSILEATAVPHHLSGWERFGDTPDVEGCCVLFYLFFFPFQPTDTGISSLGTRCHGNCTSSQLQQQWGRGISLTQKAAGGACCDAWTNPMGGHGFMGQGGCRVPALILAAGSAGCCSYLPQLTAWVLCPSGTETCSHPSWVTFWG